MMLAACCTGSLERLPCGAGARQPGGGGGGAGVWCGVSACVWREVQDL